MAGFTVSNSNKFLETGSFGRSGSIESQSLINNSDSNSGVGSNELSTNSTSSSNSKSFADTLKDAVNNVNELQKASDRSMQELATGKTDNVADVMIAAEKADIALRVMVQVRNKIIDAYQEIMKMQV